MTPSTIMMIIALIIATCTILILSSGLKDQKKYISELKEEIKSLEGDLRLSNAHLKNMMLYTPSEFMVKIVNPCCAHFWVNWYIST